MANSEPNISNVPTQLQDYQRLPIDGAAAIARQPGAIDPQLPFSAAAELWKLTRKTYLKPRALDMYRQYIKKGLLPFFGEMRLKDIHSGHLRDYQQWRQTPRPEQYTTKSGEVKSRITRAGASCINHELNCLSQILRHAGLWHYLKDFYEPLPLPKWTPPRVLTPEQEVRLFRVAASNPEWLVAYLCATVTANTTASGCELRGLRLRDIREGVLYIPSDSAKNEFRARIIPLNDQARAAVDRLIARAHSLGSCRPDQFLLPFRIARGVYDPDKPTKGWRTAFREIRAAAGLPWLRPHDLRHHAITKLLERPDVSEETVKAIAGHVSARILQHYSHIRIEAKRKALETLSILQKYPNA